MSAEIFQFSTALRSSETVKTSARVGEDIGDNLSAGVVVSRRGRPAAPATETAKNARIRKVLDAKWMEAERYHTIGWRVPIGWTHSKALKCVTWLIAHHSGRLPATA